MKKPKKVARIIVIVTIALALFVVAMFMMLFNNWLNGDKREVGNIVEKSELEILEEIQRTNFYENGWDKKIVAEIVDSEVPIPSGFEFVSGTKETGVIIKDKNTNLELMWIPYDENANVEGIGEYYKNVEYQGIESETLDSIEKYGGFYLTLEEQNQYESIKQVDNESYQTALEEAEKIFENTSSVYGNLISLTELQQVLYFASKNGIEITQTNSAEEKNVNADKLLTITGTLTKASKTNKKMGLISVKVKGFSDAEKQEIKYDKNYLSQIALVEVEGETRQVPIPNGYEYMTINELKQEKSQNKSIVKIRDDSNKNLVYVWVPVNVVESVDSLENAKTELNKLYEEYNVRNNWQNASDPTGTEGYKELLNSVREYGGFYMSEAELGYDNEGKPYNKTRGMNNSLVNLGEYYRTVEKEQIKDGITEKSGLEKNLEGGYILTYEKAKEISESLSKKSTVSHLTYGAEWDAAMLWIMKTNESPQFRDIIKDVIQTSVHMPGAKYAGQMSSENLKENNFTIETESILKINGMYGLAGNISDLTQESMEENGVTYRILRGGGFNSPGNETPMASRTRTDNIGYNDIGFRNCLYIKVTDKNAENDATVSNVNKTNNDIVSSTKKENQEAEINKSRFNFEKDTYSFSNLHINFETDADYHNKARGYYINDKWVQALTKDLDNTLKAKIEKAVNNPYSGVCFGMNLTASLLKNNMLNTNYWQNGAKKVKDLDTPITNQNILNLIEFYQLIQYRPETDKYNSFWDRIEKTEEKWNELYFKEDDDNILKLIEGLNNGNNEYLLGISYAIVSEMDGNNVSGVNYGGHALLAYGIEPLQGRAGFEGYLYSIDVYDSNIKDRSGTLYITDNLDIQYNGIGRTGDSVDSVYKYNGKSAMVLSLVANTKELDIINPQKLDFLNEEKLNEYINSEVTNVKQSDKKTAKITNMEAEIKISNELGNLVVSKEGGIEKNMPVTILPNYASNAVNNNYVQILLDDIKEYTVETSNGDDNVQAEFMFEDTYQVASANGGALTTFNEEGTVSISNNKNGKYSIQITSDVYNENMEWGTVEIQGDGANEISVQTREEGVLINSDDIENVVVQVKQPGSNKLAKGKIMTKSNSAILRTEKDENQDSSMYIYTDMDQNGDYENKEKINLVEEDIENEAKIEQQENNSYYNIKIITIVTIAGIILSIGIIILIMQIRKSDRD